MVNDSLRETCADILEALTKPHNGDPRRVGQLLRGARTLRWCERFQYGDPVPADEVDAMVEWAKRDAEEAMQSEVHDAIEDAERAADARDDAEREVAALRKLLDEETLAAYDARRAVRS